METQFEDTLKLSPVGATHGIKNRQMEWNSRKTAQALVAETYCGRHRLVKEEKVSNEVTCMSCQRAMRASN